MNQPLDPQAIAELMEANESDSTDWKQCGEAFIKLIFTIILIYFGCILIFAQSYLWIPLDYANFLIHESGHLIFDILYYTPIPYTVSEFIDIVAGSFTQCFVPFIITLYFLKKKNWYSALFGLYWLGDNLISLHFYIADSRCQCLTLFSVGGGEPIHDWHYILSHMNLLPYDQMIGGFVKGIGILCMVLSITLMIVNIGMIIMRQLSTYNTKEKS